MTDFRKLDEPVYVEALFTLPVAAPVLVPGSDATDLAFALRPDDGDLVTADDTPYDPETIRYNSAPFTDYYNRVHVIPRRLALIDPLNGTGNRFYFWNANFQTVELEDIDAVTDTGLELSFDVGLSLTDLQLKDVAVTVTILAPTQQESQYLFDWGDGGFTPFTVSLLRTNLIVIAPERPVNQTLKWKTDVMTARDGSEQRVAVMQYHRMELQYQLIMPDEEFERTLYTQLFAKGDQTFSVPMWHEPIRLMQDAVAGTSQLKIDTSRFDVKAGDQLFFPKLVEGEYEIVRIEDIQLDGETVTLFTTMISDFPTTRAFYRITTVLLPQAPAIKRGAFNSVSSDMQLRVTEFRDLFTGSAVAVELTRDVQIRDRVLSATVYTLGGLPVLNGRPIVQQEVNENFNWNYQIIDFDTGPIEQTTAQANASVTYDRQFYINRYYQDFFYNYVLNHMHGQRQPVWMPTWQHELSDRIDSMSGNTVIISDERYADDYAGDSSHRGLWIAHETGWLPRRITSVTKDGLGNSVVLISPALPLDFPNTGPFDVGFLVLARLGGDEVQIQRYPAYSFLTCTLTSTKSTSADV